MISQRINFLVEMPRYFYVFGAAGDGVEGILSDMNMSKFKDIYYSWKDTKVEQFLIELYSYKPFKNSYKDMNIFEVFEYQQSGENKFGEYYYFFKKIEADMLEVLEMFKYIDKEGPLLLDRFYEENRMLVNKKLVKIYVTKEKLQKLKNFTKTSSLSFDECLIVYVEEAWGRAKKKIILESKSKGFNGISRLLNSLQEPTKLIEQIH